MRVASLLLLAALAVADSAAPRATGAQAAAAAPPAAAVDTLPALRAALRNAEQAGDTAAIASVAEELGLEHWRADRFDSALVYLLRSRDLQAARGDSAALARVLNALGSSQYQLGNYELALESYLGALDLRAAAGNVLGQAYLYANIGKAYQDWRQFDRALTSLDSAIALAERADDGHALGYALNNKASVLVDERRYVEARAAAERSLAAYYSGRPAISARDSASAWSINTMLLGEIDLAEGRLEDALRRFADVHARARRGNTRRGQAHALLALGRVHEAARRFVAADEAFAEALGHAEAIGNRTFRLEALAGLSRAAEARGDARRALAHLRAHEALRDSVFDARAAQRVAALELEAEADRQREAASAAAKRQAEQADDLRQQRILTALAVTLLAATLLFVLALLRANREVRDREALLEVRNKELQLALEEVQTLSGFIPICASCKNVRDDAGYWQSVEAYIASKSAAQFSHSICNSCGPKLYGDDWEPVSSEPRPHPIPREAPREAPVEAEREVPR